MKKIYFLFLGLICQGFVFAQKDLASDLPLESDPIAAMLDSLVMSNFLNRSGFAEQYIKADLPHESILFSDYEYKSKLQKLNSPIPLDYNESVRHYIELYASKRPNLTSRMLGLSQLYFPMFEQVLDREGLPIEFKYLAVVESALNPVAVSKMGATGLWQFMYATGKAYDLKINSYIDERRDPYLATVAACNYFKDMYKIYKDWLLVIAAYNCGAGNVNKAIMRSGGKTNFWQIKKYLPQETQGYVPAFIAVNYVMNYHSDHNITRTPPPISFYELDSIGVEHHLTFSSIAAELNMSIDEIRYLNPIYKKNYIPYTGARYQLVLPREKIFPFIANAEKIYANSTSDQEKIGLGNRYLTSEKKKTYKVKSGESLASIAKKNDCSVSDLKQWNRLKSTKVAAGKNLIIYYTTVEKVSVPDSILQLENADTTQVAMNIEPIPTDKALDSKFIVYTIQPNDTLFSIARKFKGVTVDQLKELNKEKLSNPNLLKPGSKIKVQVEG